MAQWNRIGSRGNVEDRRGLGPTTAVGGLGVTGIALVLLFSVLTETDPTAILNQLQSLPTQNQEQVVDSSFQGEDDYEVFASTVLGSNNDMWSKTLEKNGAEYSPPRLVLFRSVTNSACGAATSDVGPHYCPIDSTIYLDETFFAELTNRFGARGGDVAEAYVISHEVGHHIQNQLGLLRASNSQQGSIKTELQADCYAGLWAHSIKDAGIFTTNEIHEALDAAAAVGDDRIQEKVTGYINPETWSHGSSVERVSAFNKGYERGEFSECQF